MFVEKFIHFYMYIWIGGRLNFFTELPEKTSKSNHELFVQCRAVPWIFNLKEINIQAVYTTKVDSLRQSEKIQVQKRY